jgi:hypothetical protein
MEALWSNVRGNAYLFASGVSAWIVWLQVVAIFQGIVVIWLFYIGIVMRFSWVPSTRDSVAPFVLGAGELTMIQLMEDPALLAYWFWVLAGIFLVSTWVSRAMFVAAMTDPANEQIDISSDGSNFDSYLSWGATATIGLSGVVVWILGSDGAAAIVCLLIANLLLLGQGAIIQHYWRQWVGGTASP